MVASKWHYAWSANLRHIACATIVALLATGAHASDTADAESRNGRVAYLRHCASCHGTSGRGDGIDADLFPSPPRNLHEGFLEKYDDATLARRIRDGRRLPLFLDAEALRRHSGDVDRLVEHIRRLPELEWTRIEPGWSAYVDRCEMCHGPTGEGPTTSAHATAATDLVRNDDWKAQTAAERSAAIRHDRAGMVVLEPPISSEEGVAIQNFVELFSPGFSLFSRHCSHCHADDGRGVATLGEVAGELYPLPAVTFDADYVRRTPADELRGKVWHMLETEKPSMPHFRVVLTEAEVTAIVRYLRAAATLQPHPAAPTSGATPASR